MSQPRVNAIIPILAAVSHLGMEGYAVKIVNGKSAIVTAATDSPIGVILDGGDLGDFDSVALIGSGLAGTVRVKLDGSPGTVALGTLLEITATGTFKADTGSGSGTVCAMALEDGAADEMIEAVPLGASGTVTIQQGYNTTLAMDAVGATLTLSGQVTDLAGNALAGRFNVGVFVGQAANDGTPYDFGDVAAGSGSVIIKEHTADAYLEVLTKADGTWSLTYTVAADDQVHGNAWVNGKITIAQADVDVP